MAQHPVERTNASYDKMAETWELPNTLMGGTRAMRKAGKKYLPKEPAESTEAYNDRLDRSTLFNAFKRTVAGVIGKVFSKPITHEDDVPDELEPFFDNIDLAGRSLNDFARDVMQDGTVAGLTHILVEMPAGDAPETVAEERAQGRRPYFVQIKAKDLIAWQSEMRNGKEVLTQIRFKEREEVPDGEYNTKIEERIRVLWEDRFEVWVKNPNPTNDDNKYLLQSSGEVSLGKIPLVTFYTNRLNFMIATPPLEDLAFLNAAHWQSSSDQRHILHVARVPILFWAGAPGKNAKPVEIGPNRMIKSEDPQSKLTYVEHNGKGIEAGRNDLLDMEDRMRVMGLELFMPKTGTQTATGKAIDSAEMNSIVQAIAMSLEQALEQALSFAAEWVGINKQEDGSYSGGTLGVNRDFGVSMQGAQELKILLDARMSGEISRETFWSELKRRGLLFDGFDADAEIERLLNEPDALGAIGVIEPVEEEEDEEDDEDADA